MNSVHATHEFRNQLGIILGFIEVMLDETAGDDQRREDLLEMRKAANRAMELLSSLTGRSERA
jgi:signal transduction histidine kinase